MPLLEVNNLHVQLQTQRGPAEAVRGIGFTLERGETLGIVGESGCGKSITVQSLMGLLPASAQGHRQHPLRRQRTRRPARARDVRDPRQPHRHDLPGADDGAEPGAHHRAPGRRAAAAAPRPVGGRRAQGGARAARARRHSRRGLAARRLSAPVLRRPAPAHRHRDGAGLRARPADRRRADHRARRHDPEADPRTDPAAWWPSAAWR